MDENYFIKIVNSPIIIIKIPKLLFYNLIKRMALIF